MPGNDIREQKSIKAVESNAKINKYEMHAMTFVNEI
jgi:hypothetical protein